ncbi:OLC1v1010473C1 [Oldenlandia corymbosa var. corymbosa]|uniref:OLC1v1010473C1 n=1 Tax=Oldenlandia corymbosa var. corymbosa TaxID=529605 RepID=A0AAV1DRE4_OLDCO|nr:OLC1v1010473C1 [Oldenlandia corymbosa var. corymbosa]
MKSLFGKMENIGLEARTDAQLHHQINNVSLERDQRKHVIPIKTCLNPTKHPTVVIVDSPYEFDNVEHLMVDANQTSRWPNPFLEEPLARWQSDGSPLNDIAEMDDETNLRSRVPRSL